MFNRSQRQRVKATVVTGDLGTLHGSDMASWDFAVDVRPEIGPVFRAVAKSDFFVGGRVPRAGDVVDVSFDINGSDNIRLELDGDARFDPHVVADQSRKRMKLR